MPPLRNHRHEAFARAVANGNKLIDAYQHAGYSRRRGNPNRLARRPEVSVRIVELQPVSNSADITNLEYVSAKLIALAA
jgi:hypothetical protein